MWCRPPHGFFFTSSAAATAFAAAIGTELELAPIAIASKELVSTEGIAAMRGLDVTRIFVDPRIDPETGDVFGHHPAHRPERDCRLTPYFQTQIVVGPQRGGLNTCAFAALSLQSPRLQD